MEVPPARRTARRFERSAAALVLLLGPAAACGGGGGGPSGPQDGSINVTISTSGSDPDADGYTLQLDSGTGRNVGADATLTLDGVSAGSHTLALGAVAGNCAVADANPRTVMVSAGSTSTVAFDIICTALPTTGALSVTTTTTGQNPDPDGYSLSLDGGAGQPLAVNGTLTVADLPVGARTVALGDVAANCSAGTNPRSVTVTAGGTAQLTFQVTCTGPANPVIASGNLVLDADGSHSTAVAPSALMNPTWSPLGDGQNASPYRIAYDAGESAPISTIAVTLLSGVPIGGIPQTLVADGHLPAWSPKGDEIAYVKGSNEIWTVRADGSGAHQVAVADTTATFTRVTWRSDGLTLAWIEDAEDYSGDPIRTIKSSTRAAPGSTNWAAPAARYVVGRTPGGLSSLTWGNTGDSLLFAYGDTREVAVLDLTGGAPAVTRLFRGGRPVWSPDDREILFVDVDAPSPRLRVYSLASGTSLTLGASSADRPDWRRAPPVP